MLKSGKREGSEFGDLGRDEVAGGNDDIAGAREIDEGNVNPPGEYGTGGMLESGVESVGRLAGDVAVVEVKGLVF